MIIPSRHSSTACAFPCSLSCVCTILTFKQHQILDYLHTFEEEVRYRDDYLFGTD
jgi:hypothetical protein